MDKFKRVKSNFSLTMLALILLFGVSLSAMGEVVVIGNSAVGVDSLSVDQAKALFLGKTKKLPDGSAAEVVDLPSGDATRDSFYASVAGKKSSQMKAYWAKRIFTGKGSPPNSLSNASAVVNWVSNGPGRVGYVDSAAAGSSVKILLTVN